jgi:hypothetical protein
VQTTRLFRSSWPYLGFFALCGYDAWHRAFPHPHPPLTPWHPIYSQAVFIGSDIFCICLMVVLTRQTSIALDKAALALFALTFLLSVIADLHSTRLVTAPLPSLRLVYLVLDLLLALLLAIRFVQVHREPPIRGI